MDLIKKLKVPSGTYPASPIAPPGGEVLFPSHDGLVAGRGFRACCPVYGRIGERFRPCHVIVHGDGAVNARLARDAGEGVCDFLERDLVGSDLQVQAG